MKIKNIDLYNAYINSPEGSSSTDKIRNLLIDIAANGIDYEQDELENLIYAILNNDLIEYQKPKYRVRLNGMVGSNGQQYVSRRVDDRGGYFICGIHNPHVCRGEITQQFTRDEAGFLKDLLNNSSIQSVEEDK
mgnify:CR=1 FL=1|jgi:hypothetical protein